MKMTNSTDIFTKEMYREYLINNVKDFVPLNERLKMIELHLNIAKELYKLDNERS